MCQFCEGVTLEGGKTSHYSLTFSLILPLALSDNCCVSSGETSVELCFFCSNMHLVYIYIYTWNANDPCFGWKRPCFGGFNPQNRGQTGSRYIYIYIYPCPYSYTTFKNHNRKSTGKKILTHHCKGGRRGGKKGQLRGGAP